MINKLVFFKKHISTFAKICIVCVMIIMLFGCGKKEEPKYDIYENHDISACGIDDPLQNIEWLKEYCTNIKKTQNYLSVHIDLYKKIDIDEYFFHIDIRYSQFDDSPFFCELSWKNCGGEYILGLKCGVPPAPEIEERYRDFFKDKEFVAKLFHSVKQ